MSRRHYIHNDTVRELTIAGVKYSITVNTDGEFSCSVQGDYLRSESMKELLGMVRRSAKKAQVKIEVPATIVGHNRRERAAWHMERSEEDVFHVTIYAMNPDTHEYKFRYADGKVDTAERHGGRGDFQIQKPMSEADVKEWKRLRDERDKANKRFEKFHEKHEYKNIFDVVKKAVEAAIDDSQEPPDESEVDPRDKPEPKRRRSADA